MTSTEHRVDRGGVDIVYDSHGPDDGPPVILLHGFPDSARRWRHQVAALTAAGYRVMTPDLRGFGRSAKPDAVDDYNLLLVVADVAAVLDDATPPPSPPTAGPGCGSGPAIPTPTPSSPSSRPTTG